MKTVYTFENCCYRLKTNILSLLILGKPADLCRRARLWLALLCFVSLPASLPATAPLTGDPFEEGIEAYQESEYDQAARSFEEAVAKEESGAARHNLALAYLQKGEPGEAVWQMERALQLEPTNEQYHFKLGALRQQLGLNAARPKWHLLAAQVISTQTWIVLLCLSFWVALAAFSLPRCGGLKARLPIKAIRAISLTVVVIASLALYLNRHLPTKGIVLADVPTDLHAAPASAAPQTGLARPGERGQVIDRFESFVEIETEGGARGWVADREFRLVQP
jgi:tetratricopeptide (TPR) repeat protein